MPHIGSSRSFPRTAVAPDPLCQGIASGQAACPSPRTSRSRPEPGFGRTNSRFNIGPSLWISPGSSVPLSWEGPFTGHRFYRVSQFSDGLSQTIGASERRQGDWTSGRYDRGGDDLLGDIDLQARSDDPDWAVSVCTGLSPRSVPHESRGGETWFLSGLHCSNSNHGAPPNATTDDCSVDPLNVDLHTRTLHSGVFAARSAHLGGVNTLAMDGSVRFARDSLALPVWRALATRAGGEAVSLDD
ncbi:DUF1559 family PulG-like putative transporter [Tautonia sociabilis]|nr:DUF1559 domain-containing protein [Tautonia sociabilis]